jgi:oxygen-independent coproporphyrinogen-3 oxidase
MENRFGIYLHIPYCNKRCSYCDFYTLTGYSDYSDFVGQIKKEILSSAEWLGSYHLPVVSSIFMGGGTPSLLKPEQYQEIFQALQSVFTFSSDIEITTEVNPETIDLDWCSEIKKRTPINRISLGAQSLQAKYLKMLDRQATASHVRNAVANLKSTGFDNISLDLIFGIPGQTIDEVKQDIDGIISLDPRHVSFYHLTLKPAHTLFSQLPDQDFAADLYEAGRDHFKEHGFNWYEISNFCKPGFESRHNMLYWSGGDYLGVGPSAASRFFRDCKFHHRKQISDLGRYLKLTDFFEAPFEVTNSFQTVLEAAFLEVRKKEGVVFHDFFNRYGYDLQKAKKYPVFLKEGLVSSDGVRAWLTDKGALLADSIGGEWVDL